MTINRVRFSTTQTFASGIVFLLAFALFGCGGPVKKEATGFTQGTTYSVIYFNDGADLQYQIDSLLLSFDRVLSTYQETSYISKWNKNEANDLEQAAQFKEVVKRALEIAELTNGAFDITVPPLMEYWFGQDWKSSEIDSSAIDSLLMFVGMHHLDLKQGEFVKTNPNVRLDVNAIAQGFSVDVLARFLESHAIFNYLVEIGGEVRASGTKPDGQAWTVGIDQPSASTDSRELALSVKLQNRSLATSGNYRKFVEIAGQKYGHTLDPRTGYPATTDLLSATVITSDCMSADALATAFMVLGFEKSKALVEADEKLDAILIFSDTTGVQTWMSAGVTTIETESSDQ